MAPAAPAATAHPTGPAAAAAVPARVATFAAVTAAGFAGTVSVVTGPVVGGVLRGRGDGLLVAGAVMVMVACGVATSVDMGPSFVTLRVVGMSDVGMSESGRWVLVLRDPLWRLVVGMSECRNVGPTITLCQVNQPRMKPVTARHSATAARADNVRTV
jgi:hypothetical protein